MSSLFKQVLKAELPNHSKEKEHVLIAAAPDGVEADDYYVNTWFIFPQLVLFI